MTETSVPQRASRATPRLPGVSFQVRQEADARAFLGAPLRSERLRVRVSRRALMMLPFMVVGLPIVFVAASLPASNQARWDVLPFGVVVFVAFLLILAVAHFTTGFFVLDPARRRVVNDKLEIPFSDLRAPRIVEETFIVTSGESGDLLSEERGKVIKSGGHVFFHTGWLSTARLEKIANALNEAIREHDERLAVRQLLEQQGEFHE